jgi:uncharacterized surface protein with fasciclin (FAS1) repeats
MVMKNFKLLGLALLTLVSISCKETKKETDQEYDSELEETLSVESEDVPMGDSANILESLVKETDFSTLVKGLKSADLASDLEQMDSLTLFAPTNDAFSKLPDGMVSDLMEPQGKSDLTKILKFHLVKGNYDAAFLKSEIESNNGVLELQTLEGAPMFLSLQEDAIMLTHDQERMAIVIRPDMSVSNGIIHGIETVIVPN